MMGQQDPRKSRVMTFMDSDSLLKSNSFDSPILFNAFLVKKFKEFLIEPCLKRLEIQLALRSLLSPVQLS